MSRRLVVARANTLHPTGQGGGTLAIAGPALPEVVPQLTSREGLVKRDRVLRDLDGVLTAAMQTVDGIDWQMASLQGHARPRWSLWR